jgi:hypothetical protein
MRAQELQCVGGACMRACKIRFWPDIEQPWRARHGRAEEYASAGAAVRRRRTRAHTNSCAGLRSMRAQESQCFVRACMREYMPTRALSVLPERGCRERASSPRVGVWHRYSGLPHGQGRGGRYEERRRAGESEERGGWALGGDPQDGEAAKGGGSGRASGITA